MLTSIFLLDVISFSIYRICILLTIINIIIIFTICIVFLHVIRYGVSYFIGDRYYTFYLFNIYVFICSIIGVIVSNSVLSFILSWDVLGLSSVFLIIHYGGYSTTSSSLVVLQINLLGDICFIGVVGIIYIQNNIYGIIFIGIFSLYILSLLSNGSLYPFNSWLLRSIGGPTPVSTLVHSSALVLGGVVYIYNFNIILSMLILSIIIIFGVMSICVSSIYSTIHIDVNNIVGLSTTLHISILALICSLGLYYIVLLHILMHSYIKSSLFISISNYLIINQSIQDIRTIYVNSININDVYLWICLLSLNGLILCGGVGNELFIEHLILGNSTIIVLVIVFCVYCGYIYSLRLLSLNIHTLNSYTSSHFFIFTLFSLSIFMICISSFVNNTENTISNEILFTIPGFLVLCYYSVNMLNNNLVLTGYWGTESYYQSIRLVFITLTYKLDEMLNYFITHTYNLSIWSVITSSIYVTVWIVGVTLCLLYNNSTNYIYCGF